jgi:hypothetical protein
MYKDESGVFLNSFGNALDIKIVLNVNKKTIIIATTARRTQIDNLSKIIKVIAFPKNIEDNIEGIAPVAQVNAYFLYEMFSLDP